MDDLSSTSSQESIFRPGQNAWRVEKAEALAFLVDGEAYFTTLEKTLSLARRSIRIVGWDFNPQIRLHPDNDQNLGEFLHALVERSPELEVYVLVWAMGPIYSSHSLKIFSKEGWSSHSRIHLRFDARHPLRGSHHQKMVTVDDTIAFVGGIDLTAGRWDTPLHTAKCPLRVKPNGESYGPVHDVQTMVSGPAARAIADLIRWRWKKATGEDLESLKVEPAPWPDEVPVDMANCTVAIGRTVPALAGFKRRRETIRLTYDAIAAARHHIYIEAQYLASFSIGAALARRLEEPDGPEILILVTMSSRGLLEQFVMANNRDRLVRRLKKADRFDRLRVMYLVVPQEDATECEILVHSKVLIIDDTLARVGSSNLNNRSEGLDTECDIAIEAKDELERQAIAGFRNRLLGEHLDASVSQISSLIRDSGSLIATVEQLNNQPRGMRICEVCKGGTTPLFGTGLLDPKMPFRPFHKIRTLLSSAFLWLGRTIF